MTTQRVGRIGQQRRDRERRRRILRGLGMLALAVALVVIIWVDLATGVWQQAVILSGVAAGLITFALTAFVVDRAVARGQHERWMPVTRLAITDLLHALADDERSELSRGDIVPRSLEAPDRVDDAATVEAFLGEVVREREAITSALARWAGFLAASADVTDLMDHVADLARLLDEVRDRTVEAERGSDPSGERLRANVAEYNARIRDTVDEARALVPGGADA